VSRPLPWFYYVANPMFRAILPLGRVRVTVRGKENVPAHGPLIVTFNHQIFLDPPLLGAYIPRDIEMMSKIENFEGNPVLAWMARNYGAFPVRRGEADVAAIRHTLQILKEERALLISPEGTRSRNGVLGEPHPGVVMVALRSGAPILPVGISGAERFTEQIRRWQPTPILMQIGRPYRLKSPTSKPNHEMVAQMSDAVMERIAAQLPPSYRGRYAQLGRHRDLIEEVV
jgi:1-acyl-sn-glycerol-3-phosphate acyltransferase